MKHLKIYENFMDLKFKDLKKYVLLRRGDSGGLDIFKIHKKDFNNFNSIEPSCKVSRIYNISNAGIKKIQDDKFADLSFRIRFIIEFMVDHSDDIDKLLEIAELKIATNKYNI